MPHAHGVGWIERSFLEKYLVATNSNEFCDTITEIIDKLVTCELPKEDTVLLDIVTNVQKHHHTKSCRKYNGSCRYSAPWLPSPKTILAKPLSSTMEPSEREEVLSKAKEILDKAKNYLEDPKIDESVSFSKFLCEIDVSEEDYMNAISVSNRGNVIVLKRDVSERYINGYNKEWLRAWNANMDIQFCLSPHAVITYITDYMGNIIKNWCHVNQ